MRFCASALLRFSRGWSVTVSLPDMVDRAITIASVGRRHCRHRRRRRHCGVRGTISAVA